MISKNGIILNCVKEDGSLLTKNRYSWSIGRGLYSLCYSIEQKLISKNYVSVMDSTYKYCLKRFLSNLNNIPYSVSYDGKTIDNNKSDFTSYFICIGFLKANYLYNKLDLKNINLDVTEKLISKTLINLMYKKKFNHYPLDLPSYSKSLSKKMCLINFLWELYLVYNNKDYLKIAKTEANSMLNNLVKYNLITENGLNKKNDIFCPGHISEAVWFSIEVITENKDIKHLTKNKILFLSKVANSFEKVLNISWDKENGGLFHNLKFDKNGDLLILNSIKTWWSAVELFVALSYFAKYKIYIQINNNCGLSVVYQYLNKFYFSKKNFDWIQKYNITHTKSDEGVGLPVRDFFHYPRAAIRLNNLLNNI